MELFGTQEITFDTIFWFGRFNEAQEGFLDCLQQFVLFVRRLDRNLSFPHL